MDATESRAAFARVMGLLRQIAEEAANLEHHYSEANKPTESTEPGIDDAVRAERWDFAKRAFDRNRSQLNDLFSAVTSVLDADDNVRDWCGREVTRMANHWESLQAIHDRAVSSATTPNSTVLEKLASHGDEIVFECGRLTVPSRLEQHLSSYRPGQILAFHDTFEDEIRNEEKRKAILKYLYEHPTIVNGIVDPETGDVTRVSGKSARRAFSWVVAAILVVAALGGAAALARFGPFSLAEGVDGGDVAESVAVVLIGMMVHVLIGLLKDLRRSRTDNKRRFASVGNWILWGHAKELELWTAILFAGVLAFFLGGLRGEKEWLTLFAAGYSGDSLIEVLLPKFEKGVVDRTEKVKGSFGIGPAGA